MGDCASSGCRASKAQTPRCVGWWMNCAVLTALPAYSLRCAARTASRFVAGGADHRTILRAVPTFHKARQRNCHALCEPPPGESELDLCSASVGTPGRLRVGQGCSAASLALAPAQSARSLGRREKGVPCCSALRLCCADAGGYRDFPRCLAMSKAKAASADSCRVLALARMVSRHSVLIQSSTATRPASRFFSR